MQSPSVYNYDNYRAFLTDFYKSAKIKDKKFSFRYFARVAGFQSFSFLRAVMIGKKNLSDESVKKLALTLKLNKEETFFFSNLVRLNQATTLEEKQAYAKEILKSRTYRKVHPLKESQFHFYSKWYYSAIRELPGLPEFKEDPVWISRRIQPEITPNEAKRALEELVKLGLLERDSKGTLRQTSALISTPDEVTASFAGHIHREFLKLAAESIQTVSREKRDISTMTLGISKQTMKKIKEMIQSFRKEITRVAAQDSTTETIYQMNLQLFPLVREEKDEEDS